jgi:hypothetical protein
MTAVVIPLRGKLPPMKNEKSDFDNSLSWGAHPVPDALSPRLASNLVAQPSILCGSSCEFRGLRPHSLSCVLLSRWERIKVRVSCVALFVAQPPVPPVRWSPLLVQRRPASFPVMRSPLLWERTKVRGGQRIPFPKKQFFALFRALSRSFALILRGGGGTLMILMQFPHSARGSKVRANGLGSTRACPAFAVALACVSGRPRTPVRTARSPLPLGEDQGEGLSKIEPGHNKTHYYCADFIDGLLPRCSTYIICFQALATTIRRLPFIAWAQ